MATSVTEPQTAAVTWSLEHVWIPKSPTLGVSPVEYSTRRREEASISSHKPVNGSLRLHS